MNKAVIYHGGGCYDGFTAAWIAHKIWPDADFYPMLHKDPLPDLTGREVVLLDITFSLPIMERLCEMAAVVMVIDHHFSAQAVLEALGDKVWAHLDMARSGAGLAWDVLIGTKRPFFVDLVEDRDLAKFQFGEKTHVYHCALTARHQTFEEWDKVERMCMGDMLAVGRPIRAARMCLARELCSRAEPTALHFNGGESLMVWCVNAPLELIFDVNEVLATTVVSGVRLPVLTWFWDGKRGVNYFSLRSWDDGPDVERVAASYGGGGHKAAAGFTHKFHPADLLAEIRP